MATLTPGQKAIETALKALVQMARDNDVPAPQEVRDFVASAASVPSAESAAVADVIPAPMNTTTVSTSGFGAPEGETTVVAPTTNTNVTSTVAPEVETTVVAPMANTNVAPVAETTLVQQAVPVPPETMETTVAPVAPTVASGGRRRTKKNRKYRSSPRRR